jgi:hypothetical protein
MIYTAYYKNYEKKKINKLHFQYYFGKQNVKTNTDLLQLQIKKTFLINFTIFYKALVMLGIVISYLSSETAGSDHEMEQNCRNRLQSCRVFE